MSLPNKKSAPSNNKKRKLQYTSLPSLLVHMEGIELIVEEKNGKRHQGILSSCDDEMNVSLSVPRNHSQPMDSEVTTTKNAEQEITTNLLEDSMLYIRGSNVRYIQFPDNANLTEMVRTGVGREQAATQKYNRGKRKA